MKTRVRQDAEHEVNRPASAQRKSDTAQNLQFDHRHSATLQHQLIQKIADSTAMTLQRQPFETTQRQVEEEEELLQGKFQILQRQLPEEEELMQGKFDSEHREADNASANQTGMPDNLKSGIESLSGIDMSDVRVHRNSSKPAQFNALAYAQGSDIHLASGQEQHLPHEAWHTVQQRQGRVKPTMQMEGQQINDDVGLEQEADVMGAKALQYKKLPKT